MAEEVLELFGDSLSIIHLSDFHFDGESIQEIESILDSISADVNKIKHEYDVHPSMIIISGDVSFHGDVTEYNLAFDKIRKLISSLKIPPELVFIVPGNHDVNRSTLKKQSTLKFQDSDQVNAFLQNKIERDFVFNKLEN